MTKGTNNVNYFDLIGAEIDHPAGFSQQKWGFQSIWKPHLRS